MIVPILSLLFMLFAWMCYLSAFLFVVYVILIMAGAGAKFFWRSITSGVKRTVRTR